MHCRADTKKKLRKCSLKMIVDDFEGHNNNSNQRCDSDDSLSYFKIKHPCMM